MNSWFIFAILAVIAIGGMTALYKVPAAKGHNKFAYSFYSFCFATVFSALFLFKSLSFDARTILFGFLWGMGYALLASLQMEILKKLDTSSAFPITSLSSHVLVIILGISFFHDKISPLQILAMALAFIVVGFYNKASKHITFTNGLFPIAASIVLVSTFCKFIQKFASVSTDVGNFTFWQLLFAALGAFLLSFYIPRTDRKEKMALSRGMLGWAALLGLLNFVGTVSIVKALSTGPFSLVYTINSFYILFASIVAWRFFGEKLTRRKVLFLLTAVVIVILIKIG